MALLIGDSEYLIKDVSDSDYDITRVLKPLERLKLFSDGFMVFIEVLWYFSVFFYRMTLVLVFLVFSLNHILRSLSKNNISSLIHVNYVLSFNLESTLLFWNKIKNNSYKSPSLVEVKTGTVVIKWVWFWRVTCSNLHDENMSHWSYSLSDQSR